MRRNDAAGEHLLVCAEGDVEDKPIAIPVGHAEEFRAYRASSCDPGAAEKDLPLAAVTAAAIPRTVSFPPPGIGVNAITLSSMFLGYAPHGDGSPAFVAMSERLARKSIADAADAGIPFMRVGMGGWFPSPNKGDFAETNALYLWLHDPESYWKRIDLMMDELDAQTIGIVPAFFWSPSIFTALAGDTTTETLRDPNSASYRLLSRYVTEFVTRYRARPTIMFYELTVELDASANLDLVKRCAKQNGERAPACAPVGNYSTNDLIAFATRLSGLIRILDPSRPISSGYAMAHRFLAHMERSPEWTGKPNYQSDSREDFIAYADDIHQSLDLLSYHAYNGGHDNERFGYSGNTNAEFLAVIKAAADRAGKRVFLGEFGDQDPPISQDKRALFTREVLNEIVELSIPYGAPFAWELYYTPARAWPISLEPGWTDDIITRIKTANSELGHVIPAREAADLQPPRIVITTAIGGSPLGRWPKVHAVASDNDRIVRVAFSLDGASETEAGRDGPFYVFVLDPSLVTKDLHTLAAIAWDAAGNQSEDRVSIKDGFIVPQNQTAQ